MRREIWTRERDTASKTVLTSKDPGTDFRKRHAVALEALRMFGKGPSGYYGQRGGCIHILFQKSHRDELVLSVDPALMDYQDPGSEAQSLEFCVALV